MAAICSVIASAAAQVSAAADLPWIAIPQATLDGIGVPVDESADEGLPNSYFQDLEPAVHPKFGLIHSKRLQTAVVETPAELTRSHDFPGDEVVQMRSGETVLIDDRNGHPLVAKAGDYFVVPAHWRGLWIFHSIGELPAREHAMVSAPDYAPSKPKLDPAKLPKEFAPARVFTPSDIDHLKGALRPMNFLTPTAAAPTRGLQGYVIFAGEPSFLMLSASEGVTYPRPVTACDSVVRVLNGTLTLKDSSGHTATFGPDQEVVITEQFGGSVTLGAGFLALSVTGSGAGSPRWPAKAIPTTESCPAL